MAKAKISGYHQWYEAELTKDGAVRFNKGIGSSGEESVTPYHVSCCYFYGEMIAQNETHPFVFYDSEAAGVGLAVIVEPELIGMNWLYIESFWLPAEDELGDKETVSLINKFIEAVSNAERPADAIVFMVDERWGENESRLSAILKEMGYSSKKDKVECPGATVYYKITN